MSIFEAEKHSKRLRDLVSELVAFSEIERQIYMPEGKRKDRRENDAEHSYSLAMTAWFLSQYIPELDQAKVIKFALAHDLVELHAGDVMAIGRTKEQDNIKNLKEKEALDRLKKDWPDFEDMTATIEEYERKDTKEALFVYSLDKILPMQLNLLSKGKTWKAYDIHRDTVVANKDEKTKRSAEVNAIWQELRKEVLSHDEYFNPGKF